MINLKNIHFYILALAIIFLGVFLGVSISSQDSNTENNNVSYGISKFFYPEGTQVATSGVMTVQGLDTQVLATSTNGDRTAMLFCNSSATADIYLGFDKDKPMTLISGRGYFLEDGECVVFDRDVFLTSAVHASSTEADAELVITEFTH